VSGYSFPFSVRQIAAAMGGDVTGRDSCNVPGPGHSRKDRSLAIHVMPTGFVVHSFANDDWKNCREYVLGKLGLSDNWQSDKALPPDTTGDDAERRKKFALKIWSGCIDPRGTLAERYLREHRELDLPDSAAYSVIRFHAGLRYEIGKYLPAMVCLLRDINTNEPCGIHRTFLDRYTGEKIDRKMLGVAKGAAIKLDAESATLTIGEGVETVLAARAAGFTPAWALGSSGAVRAFPVLRNLRELTILQENDPTSRRDVKACSRRYLGVRRPVNIVEPKVGNDFNDCWKATRG
jgi:putative DNA primase/helicase